MSAARPFLSVVMPCMGRLHQVRESAPALLAHPEIEFILVDYSCPDHCGDYAGRHWPRARVVEAPGQRFFNKCRALNLGFQHARGEWVAEVDADLVVGPDFLRTLRPLLQSDEVVVRCDVNGGFLVCRPAVLQSCGGYDERFANFGIEDFDIVRRILELGYRQVCAPRTLFRVISHGHDERVRFYPIQDVSEGEIVNRALTAFRLPRELRRPFSNPVTFGLLDVGFGDIWKSVQYACYVQRSHRLQVRLYPYWHAWGKPNYSVTPLFDGSRQVREILEALDAPPIQIVEDTAPDEVTPIDRREPFHFSCAATRVRWCRSDSGLHRRFVYQFDGGWQRERKAPPARDIPRLLGVAPGFETIRLGKHLSVDECVAAAARSDFFLGIDSGMAQLCYAVGVPVFLISYRQKTEVIMNFHGDQSGIHCATTADCLHRVRCFLGLTPGASVRTAGAPD
jgi:glycosyltransferase involved in cell wall biosynthesis